MNISQFLLSFYRQNLILAQTVLTFDLHFVSDLCYAASRRVVNCNIVHCKDAIVKYHRKTDTYN